MFGRSLRIVAIESLAFVAPLILFFVTTPLFLAHLGLATYGLWVLFNTFVGTVGFLDLGLTQTAIKYLAGLHARQELERLTNLFQTVLAIFALLACALGLITFGLGQLPLFAPLTGQASGDSLAPFLVACVLASVLSSPFFAFTAALQRYDLLALVELFTRVVQLGAGALLLTWGYNLRELLILNLAVLLTRGLALAALSRLLSPGLPFRPSFNLAAFRLVSRFSLYNAALAVGGQAFSFADRLLIGVLIGPQAVTAYTLADGLGSRIHQLFSVAGRFLLPLSSSFHAQERSAPLYLALLTVNRALAIGVAAICLPLVLGAAPLFTLWIGPTLAASSAPIFRMQAVSYSLAVLFIAGYNVLLGLGKVDWVARAVFIGVACLIMLYLVLIPVLGPLGAAVAFLAYTLAGSLVVPWLVHDRAFQKPLREYWRALVPGFVSLLPVLMIENMFHLLAEPYSWLRLLVGLTALGSLSLASGLVFDRALFRDASLIELLWQQRARTRSLYRALLGLRRAPA